MFTDDDHTRMTSFIWNNAYFSEINRHSFNKKLFSLHSLDNSGSLRLVAVYGFVSSLSVILFGSAVGNWIDRTKRLTAAKTFLAIQNLAVALACAALAAYFFLVSEDGGSETEDAAADRSILRTSGLHIYISCTLDTRWNNLRILQKQRGPQGNYLL